MAWLSLNYHSAKLKMPVELEVLAPQYDSGMVEKSRVVFLLHGAIGDRTSWLLRSQAALYAAERGLCIVMPSVKNSFYVNTYNSYAYMDFICEELPDLIVKLLPVSRERTDWMIAGCSMGGYGALRCGLMRTDLFGFIASFSGAVDMAAVYDEVTFVDMDMVFGSRERLKDSDNNLYRLLSEKKQEAESERILMTCGEDDELFPYNEAFYRKFCTDYRMEFLHKKGGHDWHFWNDSLKAALSWFCGETDYREVF